MPLPLPNLDDRDFEQLLAEARLRIRQSNTAWDDLSESDPGVVLLELFAYLTDTMIYRLNRLPNKVYIAFLRLLGVSLHPPSAASTTLRFSRARGFDAAVEIPRGTRVTLERSAGSSQPPVFMTTQSVTLPAGTDSVDAPAIHAEQIEGEQVGTATGLPGFSVTVRRAPIISGTGDPLDLIVAVEAAEGELDERIPAIKYDDVTYRIWREVENFANPGDDQFVYVVDRMSGTITFAPAISTVDAESGALSAAPAALGAVPPANRAIRVWYRRGGGADGNVAASTLNALKDPIRGVQVTNPAPATGGRDAETLENALLRGRRSFIRSSAPSPPTISSWSRSRRWKWRAPKPSRGRRCGATPSAARSRWCWCRILPESAWRGAWLPKQTLMEYATEDARQQVQRALDERRPLGTDCLVTWAHYKTVRVTANIVVRREEDPDAVKSRVQERLYRTINPCRAISSMPKAGSSVRRSGCPTSTTWRCPSRACAGRKTSR
ncbi:MAG: baseplate J/gp47 family protein [Anaerolineae bacterium]